MNYIDLHCDTLTACADGKKELIDCNLQTDVLKLKKSGCAAQCFAIFTNGSDSKAKFGEYLSFYNSALSKHGDFLFPVTRFSHLAKAQAQNKIGSMLTVENLGFTDGNPDEIQKLKNNGVIMASLVWNDKNACAQPNLVFENGLPRFDKNNENGLTERGKAAAELLDELKIIIDISHLSDGGVSDLLENRKIPLVASHSNARAVCSVSRNLTDAQIKKIADCGGVVGVNFCPDFIGDKDIYSGVYAHISHIINTGGQDCVALGSDFDGIPAPENLEDCTKMPQLFSYLSRRGINDVILEKLAFSNFARVFSEINP